MLDDTGSSAGEFMRGAVERGVSTKVSNSDEGSNCNAFTMVSGVNGDELVSGVLACEGGVWRCIAMVSKLPEWCCAGGRVWESEVGSSISRGCPYLLLTHVHLQPVLSNFLTTIRIMAIVVTVPHANTPNKEQESKIKLNSAIYQIYHYHNHFHLLIQFAY